MATKNYDSDQLKRFLEAARELSCDESEAAFENKLRKIAAPKFKGFWRVEFTTDLRTRQHHAVFHPELPGKTYRPSPAFNTPQEVYGWLSQHGCRQNDDDIDIWLD